MLADRYVEKLVELLRRQWNSQREAIIEASKIAARTLMQGGILHVFGSGHSALIAKEITGRAGGLVAVNTIPDPTEGMAERVEGYGKVLIDWYAGHYGLNRGEVMIIVSTSGRNPLPVEIALEAKKAGLYTIAITSVEYSKQVVSRHSSGKRLFEVVDLVLDTGVPLGDSLVEIPGFQQKAGPVSTIVGALLANMLILSTIEEIINQGGTPQILMSQNLDGADEHNRVLKEKYRHRLAW